ncbi:HAD family phosphatase [Vibrio sp. DW001]|uniref:HAD family hydrolase n=1 Tax=Vibrio sp. DW001 TaxID=2912315 RepID=UPI0023AF1B2B|nr:HAD family phosphatase [Vibrio sp. DW001]WED25332.1 HAD family phosphatase [Vibrio sp. DW001]
MSAKIEAALFDMDGTLIDSKPIIEQAWRCVAQEYGIELNRATIEQHVHGRSGNYTRDFLFKHLSIKERHIAKGKVDAIEETSKPRLINGVINTLTMLREKGIKLALVTASWDSRIEFILSLHGLHHYFDCVVSRSDVKHGKPHPESFLLASKRLHCNIQNCVVFEDSLSGLESGIQSGAKCIAIGHLDYSEKPVHSTYLDFKALLNDQQNTLFNPP